MDFLDQEWGGNTVREYLVVAGIILFVLLLKRFISRYLASLLFKLVHKIWKDVDRASFVNLVFQPIGLFLLILVSVVSLHKLNFPAQLNIDLYGYSVKEIVHCAGTIVLIISFIWLLLRLIDFIALILEKKADLTPEMTDNQLVVFFRDFFKAVVVIIGVMMVLSFAFGLHVGNIITGLSIVGAAIALALRESLENLIASFVIFFDKPFTTGDLVKVKDITGTVEKIGLRSTRIRSDYKTYVSVPNKQMVDSVLDNLSLRTQRRADLQIEISLQTSSASAQQLVAGIQKLLIRKDIESFNVHLSDITGTAIVIVADYYTAQANIQEFNAIKQEVNLQCLRLLEDLKIQLAGASTDIIISGKLGS